jgi:hypothetical protein
VSSLRVRMYRQGLGDCFLLTCKADGQDDWHGLIDCGVLMGTADAQARMQAVAGNVSEETGGRLDVLVATHQHWDHLSGFLQARDVFEPVAVKEVWLAWTEDPKDELAAELRDRKAKALRAVGAAARRLQAAGESLTASRLEGLLEFHGALGAGAKQTTTAALDWVKARPDATVRYLRPQEQLVPEGLAGARVYVLGPPHDRTWIKRSDPSKRDPEVYELPGDAGAEVGFFAAAEALEVEPQAELQPFEERFRVGDDEVRQDPFFADRYYDPADGWRSIEHDWLGVSGRLALQLDSDTNNTSLALAFELHDGGPVLLFPGDAQVGNWLSWEPLEWQVEAADGARKVTTPDLLARTVLYKVGHHGSHNATLKEKGLELMGSDDLVALIPVNRKMAEKKKWNMPFPPLFDRLGEKTAGRILDAEKGLPAANPGRLSAEEWTRFLRRARQEESWLDYTIEW